MYDSLPSLYIPYPQCDHCFRDVEIEDGYPYCPRCLVEWDSVSEGIPATPDRNREGTDVPCEIVHGEQASPHTHNGKTYTPGPKLPCILPSGHEGEHMCPYDIEVTDA